MSNSGGSDAGCILVGVCVLALALFGKTLFEKGLGAFMVYCFVALLVAGAIASNK